MSLILDSLVAHQSTVEQLKSLEPVIQQIADRISACLKTGGKVLLMGNGGSAADAQHIAAEFVVRFKKNRKALAAIAITTDPSIVTAIGNDFGFDRLFARQVEALARPGDVVIGISTSGASKNIIEALSTAKGLNCTTIAFLGCGGGAMKSLADIALVVPSNDTPRIQECHILVGHIVCDIVERGM